MDTNVSRLGCGPGVSLLMYNYSNENAYIIDIDGKINIKCKNPIVQLGCVEHAALFLDSFGYIHKINNRFGKELDGVLDIPVLIKSFSMGGVKSYLIGFDDILWEMDNKLSNITRITDIHKVKFVGTGKLFVIVICMDNSVWGKGDNLKGQLGMGDYYCRLEGFIQIETNEIITFISCGDEHSLFLTETRTVYSCGSNKQGQLGFKKKVKRINVLTQIKSLGLIQMIACPGDVSLCVDMEGNLFKFGEFLKYGYGIENFEEIKRIDIPPVHYITKSHSFGIVIDINGDVWYMGVRFRTKWREFFKPTQNLTKLNFNKHFTCHNNYKTITFDDFLFQIKAVEEERMKNVCNT